MKRFTSVLIALCTLWVALTVPLCAFAGAFTETVAAFTYGAYEIPAYDGDYYEELNSGEPGFTDAELNQNIYESYGKLDSKGRVTACTANIDKTLMPAQGEKRESISSVYPTGWVQKQYSFVNQKYLYNRSHIIAFQLTGENANWNNLMTGTRSFNYYGMLPFENAVADYVKADDENNVLYRVTPVFRGENLLASGVIMEAESVDDLGASVKFCVFVYNVEPGVSIDYTTGDNVESGGTIDISHAYITLSKYKYTYTAQYIRPAVKVENNRLLLPRDAYTVKYTNNKYVGTAKVTVTGKGTYAGSKSYTFKILPKGTSITKLTPYKKALTVKWKKQSTQTTGYQIQLCTAKSFKSGVKSYTVKNHQTLSRKITGLKAKKRYYVRVRTYKTVSGKKYYSSWSKVKYAKTR